MIEHLYQFRVGYPDTDKMGTIHHSNHAKYCELARWELFRSIGIPYAKIEEAGFLLPVISMSFRFLKTAQYDDLITIKTTLSAQKGAKIRFEYSLLNEDNVVISEAKTELAFVRKTDWKPCGCPLFIAKAISEKK